MTFDRRDHMLIRFRFVWHDIWIGFYWNRDPDSEDYGTLYFCPIPCCLFTLAPVPKCECCCCTKVVRMCDARYGLIEDGTEDYGWVCKWCDEKEFFAEVRKDVETL